jgi:hypothetical protein
MSVATLQLHDGRTVKLGRNSPKAKPRTLRFASYFDPAKVHPPASVDYAAKAMPALQRMYLNDTYGDCVIAGKGHALGVWTGNAYGTPVQATDHEIYNTYQSWCGPGDNGCVITDVLDLMKSRGFLASGKAYKIDGYVSVDWTNPLEVQVALYMFGALTLGINLPADWDGRSEVWDVSRARILGGHDVTAVGYDERGVQVSSWGRIFTITWPAFLSREWVEECYAILSPNWYDNGNRSPSGFDAAKLAADLQKLGDGIIPDLDPPSPTPPVPVSPWVVTGTATLQVPGLFGTKTITGPITGTAQPATAVQPYEPRSNDSSIPWLTLIVDVFSLASAILAKNSDSLARAVEKLLADLGIPMNHRQTS